MWLAVLEAENKELQAKLQRATEVRRESAAKEVADLSRKVRARSSSHRSRNWLHAFPGLFTDTSEHIRFLLFSFSVFHFFNFWFRAVD